jgi:hypothetical protein
MEKTSSTFQRRLLLYVLTGFTLYWIGNVLAVFPWLFSRTAGIIAMLISTVLWAYMSYYCMKHAPKKEWNRDTWVMALSFLIMAVVQDYFLYAVYRGISDELYVLSTFIAYGLVMILPFVVRYVVLMKYDHKDVQVITNTKLILILTVGIVFLIITLWSIRFW